MEVRSSAECAVRTMKDTDLLACITFEAQECFVKNLRGLRIYSIFDMLSIDGDDLNAGSSGLTRYPVQENMQEMSMRDSQ